MDPYVQMLLSGLIGLGTGSGGAAINSKRDWKYYQKQAALDWQYYQQQAALQFNYANQAADQNFQRQLRMWNINNEYNTPAAQAARLQEAGLNPFLMHSNGTAGYTSQMPTLQSQDSPSGGMSRGAMRFTTMPQFNLGMLTQIKNQEAQTSLINAQSDYYEALADKTAGEASLIPTQRELLDSQITLNESIHLNYQARTAGQQINNYITQNTANLTIEQQEMQLELMEKQYELYFYQVKEAALRYKMDYNTFDFRQDAIEADARIKLLGVTLKAVELESARLGLNLTQEKINIAAQEFYNLAVTGKSLELEVQRQESDIKWFVESKAGRAVYNIFRTVGSALGPASNIAAAVIKK